MSTPLATWSVTEGDTTKTVFGSMSTVTRAGVVVAIGHTFNYKRDFYIPADEVTETEGKRTKLLAEQV